MQTHISKIFIFLLLFTHTLFGCALCSVYSPETKVSIEINADDKKIKTASITWVLSKEFSEQLTQIYDMNQNNYLDKKELVPVEEALLDYIVPKNYLTHISYDEVIDKNKSKKAEVISKKTYIKNSRLHFTYELNFNYDFKKDNVLYININDDQNYFVLILVKNTIKFNAPFEVKEIIDNKSAIFYFDENKKIAEGIIVVEEEFKELQPVLEIKNEDLKTEEINADVKEDETLLGKFSKKVKDYLLKIENGDDFALFFLLGISFLYGMIHALGPGHGKSLAFSYFVSNKSSYLKAFIISQASAFVHIIGALILVMVSVFLLQSVLNNFVKDSVEILTKISAIMIILLAIYILYNKLNHKSCSCSSCSSSHTHKQESSKWSTIKPISKSPLETKPTFIKRDLYFVLTAGLIPCPGTVILFIYAFILKTYFAVFLAAIFISLGMGVIIFASSFLGVSVNKLSSKSHKITNTLEILAPIVMFILGLLLYFNAQYV